MPILHACIGRIDGIPWQRYIELTGVRRTQEARPAGTDRCPCVARSIDAAEHDKRKLRIEQPVLFDQMIPDRPATDSVHFSGYTRMPLQRQLTLMPWAEGTRIWRGVAARRNVTSGPRPTRTGPDVLLFELAGGERHDSQQ